MDKNEKNEKDLELEKEKVLQESERNEELEYDSDIEYEDESLPKDKIKKLREKLKACEKEKREYLEGWQRMKADAVNEKKRFSEQLEKAKTLGKSEVLEAIVPVLDSFELAFKGEAWEKLDDIWKQGIEYIHRQFEDALQSLKVTSFGKEGEVFDATLHEAVKEVSADKKEDDGKIAKVLRKGYKTEEKVLRPAQVEVFVFKKD